ncbi:DUF4251 domain-containing protein [Flavobacteriaceae bacterium F08102]|nr:DUF4251 domain-containing protein [Flavobacteriaceae bacterium F08102]
MRTLLILFSAILLFSCAGQKNATDLASQKVEFEKMNELVKRGNFNFSADRAVLTKLGPMDLSGNFNYLRFKNDSVFAELPFFGERYMGGGYGNDGGIKFEGAPENLTITPNIRKKKVQLEFSISEHQERFDVSLHIFQNNTANLDITSSNRSYISYRGSIEPLEN